MSHLSTCPQCHHPFPVGSEYDSARVCTNCGWMSQDKYLQAKKSSQRYLSLGFILGAAMALLLCFSYIQWDRHMFSILPLKVKQWAGVADSADYLQIVSICKERKHAACMETALHQWANRFPHVLSARLQYADVLFQLKKVKRAEAAIRPYFQAGGTDPHSYYLYARILAELGKVAPAKKFYKKVLLAKPDVLQVTVSQHYLEFLVANRLFADAKAYILSVKAKTDDVPAFMQQLLEKLEKKRYTATI